MNKFLTSLLLIVLLFTLPITVSGQRDSSSYELSAEINLGMSRTVGIDDGLWNNKGLSSSSWGIGLMWNRSLKKWLALEGGLMANVANLIQEVDQDLAIGCTRAVFGDGDCMRLGGKYESAVKLLYVSAPVGLRANIYKNLYIKPGLILNINYSDSGYNLSQRTPMAPSLILDPAEVMPKKLYLSYRLGLGYTFHKNDVRKHYIELNYTRAQNDVVLSESSPDRRIAGQAQWFRTSSYALFQLTYGIVIKR